jgi:hypothetical protein
LGVAPFNTNREIIDVIKNETLNALWGALCGKDLKHYPRQDETKPIESKALLDAIHRALDNFSFESKETETIDPKLLIDRAKDSLEEVKKQTEYQDGKAGRLLTIVAFLTAAVGTVFGKFVDIYPLHKSLDIGGWASFWVASTYLLFGAYLLFVAAGAMVTFHAMSTRFVWPGGRNLADLDEVRSFLFFQQIIRTKPEAWGNAFAGSKTNLLRGYYKHYVAEAYLVAAKVADKVRYLDPGQRLLLSGIRVLLGLFILVMITFALVPPTNADDTRTAHSGFAVQARPDAGTATSRQVEASFTSTEQHPTEAAKADGNHSVQLGSAVKAASGAGTTENQQQQTRSKSAAAPTLAK